MLKTYLNKMYRSSSHELSRITRAKELSMNLVQTAIESFLNMNITDNSHGRNEDDRDRGR